MHEAALDSNWRRDRWDTDMFLRRMKEHGARLSPVFAVVGVHTSLFRVDWLHAVDQDVGQDVLGNLFELLQSKLPGQNMEERVAHLATHMHNYYETYHVEDRLKELGVKHSEQRRECHQE